MQPFKRIQQKKQALSYFLASTWQNWMKRRDGGGGEGRVGRRQFQAWAEGRAPTPHPLSPPPPPTCCRGWSECDWPSSPSGSSGFFSQYSDPLHRPPPHSRPLTPSHPPTHTLHFSPMVLSFSTDQAFNSIEDSLLSYAYRTERKKKKKVRIIKSTYYELCKNISKGMVMILIICEFCYEILYESSIHLFFKSKKNNMGELRDAAFASCWGSAAMETKQIWTWVCSCSIIYCVDCFIFKSGWGRGISIFFLATHHIFVYCSFVSFIVLISVQSCVPRCPGTGNVVWRIILSFLWNCWYNDGDG